MKSDWGMGWDAGFESGKAQGYVEKSNEVDRLKQQIEKLDTSNKRFRKLFKQLRHRTQELERAGNALINSMMNAGEPGADVDGDYTRLQNIIYNPTEYREPEPVEAIPDPSNLKRGEVVKVDGISLLNGERVQLLDYCSEGGWYVKSCSTSKLHVLRDDILKRIN